MKDSVVRFNHVATTIAKTKDYQGIFEMSRATCNHPSVKFGIFFILMVSKIHNFVIHQYVNCEHTILFQLNCIRTITAESCINFNLSK